MPKAGEVRLKTTVSDAKAAAAWLADYLKATSRGTILGGAQGLTPRTLKLIKLINLLQAKSVKRGGNSGFVMVLDRKLLAEVQFLHFHMQAKRGRHLIGLVTPLDRFTRSVNAALAGRGRRARSSHEMKKEAQSLQVRIARNAQSISSSTINSDVVDFLIAQNDALKRNIRRLNRAALNSGLPAFEGTVLTGSLVLRKST